MGVPGYRYYFDYPASNPLVRFLMIAPGVYGSASPYNTYTVNGEGYNWVSDTIDAARALSIPWIVVAMHKNYITVIVLLVFITAVS